nr:hypothetical protein [Tanacetum cinerariifolium]
MQELFRKLFNDVQNIHEELAEYINTLGWNRPAFYDDDDDDDVDYTIAITPVLSTEEPDNSLIMGDEHLDTIPATESNEVIKSSVEDLVPIPSESEGIPDTMCDVHLVNNPTPLEAKDHFEIVINSNDDISSSDDDSLYKENIEYVEASPHDSKVVSLEIEALKDTPTLSSEFLTKSSSTSPKFFLEETNTFDNSLPEFENFCFDLEEISSGSTTTHSDVSLSEYDSFIFDPSNDQFSPTDRSDFTHEGFADELAHIISPPEYDCFCFRNLPDPGELISILNSGIRKNLSSTTRVNLPIEDNHSPLLAYVVWIFLAYLTYPVIPPYLHLFRNEDTIFDPGIDINRFYSFKPDLSHWCGTFKKFSTHCSHLNESLMEILLHLAGSQPMLKSSYKAEDGVIISIPPLVGGVADVMVEIKGTEFNQASLNLLSNEMMANVNVLGPGVLDVIVTQSNGTTIITIQGNLVEVKTIVFNQFIAKELSTSGCASSRVLTTCMICVCIGQFSHASLNFLSNEVMANVNVLGLECWTLLQHRAMALRLSQHRGILLKSKP